LPDLLFNLVGDAGDGRLLPQTTNMATVSAKPAMRELVDALTERRLLVSDAAEGKNDPHATVRLAHEALISRWPRARDIIETLAGSLRIRARVEAAAAIWEKSGRDASFLLGPGTNLNEANVLLAKSYASLPTGVRAYIASSVELQKHLKRKELLSLARSGLVTGAAIALVGFVLVRNATRAPPGFDLGTRAVSSLGELADLAAAARPDDAAPFVSNALDVARALAAERPDDQQAQNVLVRLQRLCVKIGCKPSKGEAP
jgi:hypothetical protein